MADTLIAKPEVLGRRLPIQGRVLTPGALEFLAWLQRRFESRRRALLADRGHRQAALLAGEFPRLMPETTPVREARWRAVEPPPDVERRWVELLTPAQRKPLVSAFNAGADGVVADLEDSLSPTWQNVLEAHGALHEAVRRTLYYTTDSGQEHGLMDPTPVLWVRPRGLHLAERHVSVDGQPMSASLFDFGLYAYHNAHELRARRTGAYYFLPKLESHQEAKWWNDVILFAGEALGVSAGTIRVTVQIETVLAAFEMEEILYELREHAVGLAAGRWDYVFSLIKKFRHRPEFVLPDRDKIGQDAPFMRAFTSKLVDVCHRRDVHAIGGAPSPVPRAGERASSARAVSAIKTDKLRDAWEGFDGGWVTHPRLVPAAREAFGSVLGDRAHQKDQASGGDAIAARALLDVRVADGGVSIDGVIDNVNVALRYLYAWLAGTGAVSIYDMREDTATAEIARSQLWQWMHHGITLGDGKPIDAALYAQLRDEEESRLREAGAVEPLLVEATGLLNRLVLTEEFFPFLTLPGYRRLR